MIELLDLPTECLLHIFSFLNIEETFDIMGRLCRRMDEIGYCRIARLKHYTVNLRFYPKFTYRQLIIIGSHLKSINITAGYSMDLEPVQRILHPLLRGALHKQLLEELSIHYIKYSLSYGIRIYGVAGQLHKLDLSYCQLTDEMLGPLLRRCLVLKDLRIIANYELGGESLSEITNKNLLEYLAMEYHNRWTFIFETHRREFPNLTVVFYKTGRFDMTECGPADKWPDDQWWNKPFGKEGGSKNFHIK